MNAPLHDLLDRVHGDPDTYGTTYATVVVQHDEVVDERYGGALPHADGRVEPVTAATPLLSWSMAKSVLHAVVGTLVASGAVDPAGRAPVPEWDDRHDPRRAITLEHLLTMRDGLRFLEDYVNGERSDTIEMLFGSGRSDVAHYAATRALARKPGTHFNYSSGTSNIVARIVGDIVGRGEATQAYLQRSLFGPIGMASARIRCDEAGSFVGSSFVYATARDWARFGRLYLHGGVWDGTPVLPPGWVDHGRRARSRDQLTGRLHGAHWWVVGDDLGTYWASGYEGQSVLVCPPLDLVLVRLGRSPESAAHALFQWRRAVVAALRPDTQLAANGGRR